VSFELTFEGVK